GAYFIVHRPAPATKQRLVNLTIQHLRNVKRIAESYPPSWSESDDIDEDALAGPWELAHLLEELPEIEVRHEAAPAEPQPDDDAPESLIYDVVGDWFADLQPIQSEALLLGEAFYSIACDYFIAHYLMWPLYRNATDIEEPFVPYFELW